MQAKLNCLVADDEELAQQGMVKYINQVPFLNISGICSNGFEIIEELKEKQIDLLFLDIQMPGLTGIEFLKSNDNNAPMIIVTTAYPDYALMGYEYNIVDYLLKPISFERFLKSVTKAREIYELKSKPRDQEQLDPFFFIKSGGCIEKIFYDEILFVKSLQNYVDIYTETKRYTCYLTLKNVEEYLPQKNFIKVNKSYIVSIPKIDKISGSDIYIGKQVISIARSGKEQVINAITGQRLLIRK